MPVVASIPTVIVGTPTLLATAGATINDRKTVVVKNPSGDIWLGGSTVADTTGFKVATGESLALDLGPGDALYAIAITASKTVSLLVTRS